MSTLVFNIIVLEWLENNGSKCENDRHFLIYHCWFQLISIVIHIQAILDFQNNLYFQETHILMPQSAAIFEKKRVLHQKGSFPFEKQAFGLRVML